MGFQNLDTKASLYESNTSMWCDKTRTYSASRMARCILRVAPSAAECSSSEPTEPSSPTKNYKENNFSSVELEAQHKQYKDALLF